MTGKYLNNSMIASQILGVSDSEQKCRFCNDCFDSAFQHIWNKKHKKNPAHCQVSDHFDFHLLVE